MRCRVCGVRMSIISTYFLAQASFCFACLFGLSNTAMGPPSFASFNCATAIPFIPGTWCCSCKSIVSQRQNGGA
ncbi:hypothetical protein BGW36DRAFT_124451 [Talaromyces proteolyticus]|uniref:Uncharacterized protein n=1 Tax=Talaromyces proteolyticus TaxID=1131652 RepID=A0AAD4KUF5_9EURO|nr:uncharacterized protein BGW36DRAFT_124451 [Talaromyces proteolyticus]KAH8700186.1 hypothetical protein BGW36DRAFT_124451 [Talaromyces proteolyticus]